MTVLPVFYCSNLEHICRPRSSTWLPKGGSVSAYLMILSPFISDSKASKWADMKADSDNGQGGMAPNSVRKGQQKCIIILFPVISGHD